uniref:Potassium channel tetramerisation-type BTB domain-containing protein n=1 Tax=Parascaris equorum TaxID=6256 RepID=A0A914RIS1_PAREQ
MKYLKEQRNLWAMWIYRCPTSFLASFARQSHEERLECCDGFLPETREYFFERSGKVFEPIYDFLTMGHFHRPEDPPEHNTKKEINGSEFTILHLEMRYANI